MGTQPSDSWRTIKNKKCVVRNSTGVLRRGIKLRGGYGLSKKTHGKSVVILNQMMFIFLNSSKVFYPVMFQLLKKKGGQFSCLAHFYVLPSTAYHLSL